MIQSEADFLVRLISIADNFKWQMMGTQICAFKGSEYYDPLTAYVKISRGEYIPRHKTDDIPAKARMHPSVFKRIMQAIYKPDYADHLNSKLRRDIIDACGIKD